MKIIGAPALGLALYLLAGCSGGGSGGTTSPVAARIDAGNTLIVATATMSALASAEDIGAVDQLLDGLGKRPAGPMQAQGLPTAAGLTAGPDGSVQDRCRVAQLSAIVTWDDPDVLRLEHRLARGDSFSINFSDCRLAAERLYSGRLDVRVDRFAGTLDSNNVEYLYSSALRDLRIASANTSYVANGDMQMFFGSTSFPLVFAALSGQRLSIDTDGESATLRDYDLASEGVLLETPDMPGSADTIYDGFLSSSKFAGEVRFQTQLPFRTNGQSAAEPSQGRIHVFGADGAVLQLTVAGGDVQLELDADGDGRYEHKDSVTWVALTDTG